MTNLTIIILLTFSIFFTDSEKDVLCWDENYRITFDDFKSTKFVPEKSTQDTTHINGSILKTILVNYDIIEDTVVFNISACMDRNKSWIKSKSDTATLLHEQGHFDITEVYARLLRREILKINSIEEGKELWEEFTKLEELKHNEFDIENSGTKAGINEKWRKMIILNLSELEEYKDPIVKVINPSRTSR